MIYNDTTNKSGLLQTCEFFCGFPDGGISSDSYLKAIFCTRLNSAFDRILPTLLSRSGGITFDDTNHTDLPIGTFAIENGVSDYNLSVDDNALDILNIAQVAILSSVTDTEYRLLAKMDVSDERALNAMSPNPSEIGVPSYYLEKGNTLFLYPRPNYDKAAGVKISFEREVSYFATTDTTKEPGIPKPFHELLAIYASYDWCVVNKSANTVLITRLEAEIARRESNLNILQIKRNPQRNRIVASPIRSI